jgi:alpha-aminoadipic semialdehyde synthase
LHKLIKYASILILFLLYLSINLFYILNKMEERKANVICIRRENKNKWERRVPLIPEDCRKLIAQGIKIIVQPSALRCYTDKQYEDAGCELREDIQRGNIILGVKEVPLDFLYPDKTYLYFSHTIKGQKANMPALKDILDKKIRLIDYECIREATGKNPERLVAFGRYAGIAGAIDFLQGVGEFLLNKKIYTPFINTGYSYMYPSVAKAKESIKKVGELISKKHLPEELSPFVIGFTSNGRVSKGAQEIISLLPHELVDPEDLASLLEKKDKIRRDIVYITIIESKHMYLHKTEKNFDKKDFYEHPENYDSIFAEKYTPYLSILYHCMFWNTSQPRILTNDQAHDLAIDKKLRLFGVSDITCDFKGSIELLQKFTTIENPFYTLDPITGVIEDDFSKMTDSALLYHAVDHLPAELSIDASQHFSEKLTPFIKDILKSNYPSDYQEELEKGNLKNFPLEILNACETWNGKLMPKYAYLQRELEKFFLENDTNRRKSA